MPLITFFFNKHQVKNWKKPLNEQIVKVVMFCWVIKKSALLVKLFPKSGTFTFFICSALYLNFHSFSCIETQYLFSYLGSKFSVNSHLRKLYVYIIDLRTHVWRGTDLLTKVIEQIQCLYTWYSIFWKRGDIFFFSLTNLHRV